jgi:hypothetical protein
MVMLKYLTIIGKNPTFVLKFSMNVEEAIQEYSEEPLTRQLVMDMLRGYQRPNDKISELVKAGVLTALKNGLYISGPKIKLSKPEPFLVANHLRGPSAVSMESALSHWGLIPERVYEVTSITTKASRIYETPIGRFSYFHTALPYYAFGLKSISLTARQVVLIASPEKALCDKIVQTSGVQLRSPNQTMEFLLEDMRIDEEALKKLDLKEMDAWVNDAPKKSSIAMLIKTLRRS